MERNKNNGNGIKKFLKRGGFMEKRGGKAKQNNTTGEVDREHYGVGKIFELYPKTWLSLLPLLFTHCMILPAT